VNGHLILTDGTEADLSPSEIENTLHAGKLLWLDLASSDDDTLAVLKNVFNIHPLAIEDAAEWGQRPKFEEYDNFTYLVFYGANRVGDPLPEVHFFYAENYLISVHHDDCMAFAEMRQSLRRHKSAIPPSRLMILHHVLDCLVDSVFPPLSDFDDQVDALEDQIFAKPTDGQLATMFSLKRWLVEVRKLITPQRDMLESVLGGRLDLPGMTHEIEPYFRDLYDHLIRISDLVDSYRDLLSGSMDAYLSIVSNRLNVIMKQLTIIATVFLPLSFLTGFFGQNFAWLVNRLGSIGTFFGLGIGTEVVAVIVLVIFFRRRGWMS
jgi:magnesium transporter